MIKEDIDVTIIDSNSKAIERINDHLDLLTVNANGLEVEVLKELNISSYDYLFAVTDSDETNTIICSLAKKLGCVKTIARMRNPEGMLKKGNRKRRKQELLYFSDKSRGNVL